MNTKYWIGFSSIEQLDSTFVQRLYNYYGDVCAAFNCSKKDFDNIDLCLMDAKNMSFPDKSFDVLLNTSFHEFDLSHGEFSLDLDLKKEILEEMIRVSNTIIFVEPTEDAVTNELFKVFDPSEEHGIRIAKSNELIKSVLEEAGYKLVETGLTFNDDHFTSRTELEEEMLAWWADIKVPQNDQEKAEMIAKIDDILEKAGMLETNHVVEDIRFNVYKKEV